MPVLATYLIRGYHLLGIRLDESSGRHSSAASSRLPCCQASSSNTYRVVADRRWPHFVQAQAEMSFTRPVNKSSGKGRCTHSCRSCLVWMPQRLHAMMRVS